MKTEFASDLQRNAKSLTFAQSVSDAIEKRLPDAGLALKAHWSRTVVNGRRMLLLKLDEAGGGQAVRTFDEDRLDDAGYSTDRTMSAIDAALDVRMQHLQRELGEIVESFSGSGQ